jgi:glycerophosphoryl diester phosphodiesterase
MSMERALDFITARPIAHRGLHDASRGIIENTASAFQAAIDKGYAIECDLQITRDGEAVLFHDDAVERVIDGTGLVRDMTAAEIKALDIRHSKDHVQTLAEMLAQVKGQVPLVIELKPQWDGDERLAARTVAVMKGYQWPYCLMSYDPDVVAAIRRMSPETIRGIVAEKDLDYYAGTMAPSKLIELRTLAHLPRSRPDFLSFHCEELPWAPVAAFRAGGKPVISWTIRSPEQARRTRRHSDQITFEGFLA